MAARESPPRGLAHWGKQAGSKKGPLVVGLSDDSPGIQARPGPWAWPSDCCRYQLFVASPCRRRRGRGVIFGGGRTPGLCGQVGRTPHCEMDERLLQVWLVGINTILPRRHVRCGRRGTHEHRNMTMADRCGELGQQLAEAIGSSQCMHCTCHTLHAAAEVSVLQQWRNNGVCTRAVLEGRGGSG